MIKVAALSYGWSLYTDPANAEPWLKHRDGRLRMPHEVARLPEVKESHAVYSEISRVLDVMDREWRLPGEDSRFIAADSAAMVMESMFRKTERWIPTLRTHGMERAA